MWPPTASPPRSAIETRSCARARAAQLTGIVVRLLLLCSCAFGLSPMSPQPGSSEVSDFGPATCRRPTIRPLELELPLQCRHLADVRSHEVAVFVSHQWCGLSHPDPQFAQLAVLQGAFRRAAAGTLRVDADFLSLTMFGMKALCARRGGRSSWGYDGPALHNFIRPHSLQPS